MRSLNEIIIPFQEPPLTRNIYVNEKTNVVHLLVSLVSGQNISTDNTCKTDSALKDFLFAAREELQHYEKSLHFDISLLQPGDLRRVAKEGRLSQIKTYIEVLQNLSPTHYFKALQSLTNLSSNAHSIQLRPFAQDFFSKVWNPTFSINREKDASELYKEMYLQFPTMDTFISAVLGRLSTSPTFSEMQEVLTQSCRDLFGLELFFDRTFRGIAIDKTHVDDCMGFYESPGSTEEYINALLDLCVKDNKELILMKAPFYSIPDLATKITRTERLSLLTQFFLAHVNIYCKVNHISTENFGKIFDTSFELSQELIRIIVNALKQEAMVEDVIFDFFNRHLAKFKLTRPLLVEEQEVITEKFTTHYRTVMATNDNMDFDDFIILMGEGSCVSYHGNISLHIAEISDDTRLQTNRDDFAKRPAELPHKNDWILGATNLEKLACLSYAQFEHLPRDIIKTCLDHPYFQTKQFFHAVSKSRLDDIKAIFCRNSSTKQLLETSGDLTDDYGQVVFHGTAYEFAQHSGNRPLSELLMLYMQPEQELLEAQNHPESINLNRNGIGIFDRSAMSGDGPKVEINTLGFTSGRQ